MDYIPSHNYLNKKKKRENDNKSQSDKSLEESDSKSENDRQTINDEFHQKITEKLSRVPTTSNNIRDTWLVGNEITDDFYSTFINGNYNYYWKIRIPKNHDLVNKEFIRTPNLETKLYLQMNLKNTLPSLKLTYQKNEIPEENFSQNNIETPYYMYDENIISEEKNKLDSNNLITKSQLNTYSQNIYNKFFLITQRADITYIIFTHRQDTVFKDLHFNDNIVDEKEIKPELLQSLEIEDLYILIEINLSTKYIRKTNNEHKFGYVGLINEGMTCYMNSLLQTLNILGAFKKAVFQIPIVLDDYENSISLSLQRLFYDLLKDENPVSTAKLINSFGWGKEQIQEQHDVQEFNLVLSEAMERKMKNTRVEGTFSQLFEGKLINYIHCLEVDYKKNIEEKFCDLQLTVKNCRNIYESFDKYIEEEILDNENKYDADEHGKQKAKKGIKFKSFPKVLILQLKRFEYIPSLDRMMKINDFFEYPEEIDISKYLIEETKKEDCLYSLHSVVVHKGSINSGHYYAFIKPTIEDSWIKFNDENVRPASKTEVLESNYGGVFSNYTLLEKDIFENKTTNDSNAYILIYIQNPARSSILQPLDLNTDISEQLKEKFETEKKKERKAQLAKIRKQKNMDIYLISNEILKGFDRYGIINNYYDWDIDHPFKEKKERRFLISFPLFGTVRDLYRFISKSIQVPVKDIRLFIVKFKACDNFLKRFNFDLQELTEEDNQNRTMINLNQISENKNLTFFVYSKKNIIFDQTPIYEEEYIINNNEDKNILISKKDNIWNFNINIQNVLDLDQTIEAKKLLSENIEKENSDIDNKLSISFERLICFKFFNLKNKERIIRPSIEKIVLARGNTSLAELVKEHNLLEEYDKYLTEELIFLKKTAKLNYLLEFSTIKEDIDYSKENFYYQPITNPDEKVSLFRNKFTIIALDLCFENNIFNQSYKSLLDTFLYHNGEDLFNDIYLRTSYLKNLKCPLNEEKQRFSLKFNERKIKAIIYQKIKINNELNLIIEDIPYYDENKSQFNFEKFKENFNPDYIEIYREIKENYNIINNNFYLKYNKYFPLTAYIHPKDLTISYRVKIFNYSNDHEKKTFCLFDRDNNLIKRICVALPKSLKKCTDVISYLYNPILKSYYQDIPKEEFFFILQAEEKIMVLDIFLDSNENLYQHKSKQKIIYRIQPYPKDEIQKFNFNNKHFIAFLTKDNSFISYPILIFININERVSELRRKINDKIRKIHCLCNLEIPLDKYKIYTCNHNNHFPYRMELIGTNKDDQSISSIHKSKIYNILVEVPINLENKQQLKII